MIISYILMTSLTENALYYKEKFDADHCWSVKGKGISENDAASAGISLSGFVISLLLKIYLFLQGEMIKVRRASTPPAIETTFQQTMLFDSRKPTEELDPFKVR